MQRLYSQTSDAPPPAGAVLSDLLRPVWRARYRIAAVGAVCAIAGAAWSLSQPRTWTSTASFMPEAPRTAGNLSSLAAQFGVNVGADAGQSLQFYTDLVTSREILLQMAAGPFVASGRQGDLATLYGIGGETPALRRDALLKRLRAQIHAANSPKTGIISLAVSAPEPALAKSVADKLIASVSAFNMEKRQSRAGAERQFLQARLDEARTALLAAQNRLQDFLQSNRGASESPRLTFDRSRLEQQVNIAQGEVTTLTSAFEQARLEEVRDTPVITVVEPPDLPARVDSRGGAKNTILGGLLGVILASAVIVMRARWRSARVENRAAASDVEATVGERVTSAR